jgi:hypothetical protein
LCASLTVQLSFHAVLPAEIFGIITNTKAYYLTQQSSAARNILVKDSPFMSVLQLYVQGV